MHRVLISLSSFGAGEVRRHSQLEFTRLAHSAGDDLLAVTHGQIGQLRAVAALSGASS
jgi:hypothetical protein